MLSQLLKPTLCFTETCVDFPRHPEPALCAAEICVHLSKHSGWPSALWVLCALLLAPSTYPLCHRACECLSQHPRPALYATGLLCASLDSLSLQSSQSQGLWVAYGLRNATSSMFCCLGPHFAWLSAAPLCPSCEGASKWMKTLLPLWLPPSLRAQAPVLKFFFSSIYMSPS